ncbi:MAG: TfoX/Sxy family protein [Planctomycetota bacterium]|jgi:DNA transformation protein
MSVSDEYITYVLDQLAGLGEVESRRMFGGAGIYCNGLFFAIIADDVLYFKVDDTNRAEYEEAGMEAFKPFPDKPEVMSSYQVPVEVLENRDRLAEWASKSMNVAMRKRK